MLINVWDQVNLLAYNVWATRCTALLCLAIFKPLKC